MVKQNYMYYINSLQVCMDDFGLKGVCTTLAVKVFKSHQVCKVTTCKN